jgi:hypothetical protein
MTEQPPPHMGVDKEGMMKGYAGYDDEDDSDEEEMQHEGRLHHALLTAQRGTMMQTWQNIAPPPTEKTCKTTQILTISDKDPDHQQRSLLVAVLN